MAPKCMPQVHASTAINEKENNTTGCNDAKEGVEEGKHIQNITLA